MSMFATPRTVETADGLDKHALLDALCVFRPIEYDPAGKSRYSPNGTPTLLAHVTVVDGDHAGEVEDRFYAAGNLARQIGEALDVGAQAPGRIRAGKSANGRDWFGIEWTLDEADVRAAEAAMTGGPTQTLGQQTRATVADLKARAAQADDDELPPF